MMAGSSTERRDLGLLTALCQSFEGAASSSFFATVLRKLMEVVKYVMLPLSKGLEHFLLHV